jgi:hypothetical protein
MKRYSINNGKIEAEPEGIFIRYDDIRDCLTNIVRQPHAHNAARAQRHHEAIADLISMIELPNLEPVVLRDHRRVHREPEPEDIEDAELVEAVPTPVLEVKKRRGRPPKDKNV